MVIQRRLSDKKTRFTCKKIAFLEYQRYKLNEITKDITQKKRLTKVLFVPQANEDLRNLTSESMHKILHRGSLFHDVSVLESVNGSDGGIEDVFYNNIFNIKCLSNHDLSLLYSLLIKFPRLNYSLLSRTFDQILINFETLSTSELSHIFYWTSQLDNGLRDSFSSALLPRGLKALARKECFKGSQIAKLVHSLDVFGVDDTHFISKLIRSYPKDIEFNRQFSRDIKLIVPSMIKFGIEDYKILSLASEYFNDNLLKILEEENKTLNHSSRNLFDIDKESGVEGFLDIKSLLTLLDGNRHFGYNHKALLNNLNRYINGTLNKFLKDPKVARGYEKRNDEEFLYKVINLIKTGKYTRGNRHDLTKLMANFKTHARNESYWDPDIISKIGKFYITQTELFRQFLLLIASHTNKLEYQKLVPILKEYKIEIKKGSDMDTTYPVGTSPCLTGVPTDLPSVSAPVLAEESKGRAVDGYKARPPNSHNGGDVLSPNIPLTLSECVRRLPEIYNWNIIRDSLSHINRTGRIDLLPLVCSLFQESGLIFEDLPLLLFELIGIAEVLHASGDVLLIDNYTRIMKLCLDTDLQNDRVNHRLFLCILKLLLKIEGRDGEEFTSSNPELFSTLEGILCDYLLEYSKKKSKTYPNIVEDGIYSLLLDIFLKESSDNHNLDTMIAILEESRNKEGNIAIIIKENYKLMKFITYQCFLRELTQ